MGSLMAGWQTNPVDEKEAFKRSTSSVTREEVDRFWKVRKGVMEKHMREAQTDANHPGSIVVPASPGSDSGFEGARSPFESMFVSPPITPTTPTSSAPELVSARSPGWWQKSHWAFLNEPPVIADRQNRYVAQFGLTVPLNVDSDAPSTSNDHLRHAKSSLT